MSRSLAALVGVAAIAILALTPRKLAGFPWSGLRTSLPGAVSFVFVFAMFA
jgi:hypothetical protein